VDDRFTFAESRFESADVLDVDSVAYVEPRYDMVVLEIGTEP